MPFVVQASAVVQYTKIVADPSRSATSSTIVTESDFGVDEPSRNLNPSTPFISDPFKHNRGCTSGNKRRRQALQLLGKLLRKGKNV
jgi:hypothetical protein